MLTAEPRFPDRPATSRRVPQFGLYGETTRPRCDLLHAETLQARSRLYRWRIGPHRHVSLCQALWLESGTADVVLDGDQRRIAGPAIVLVSPGAVHGFGFAPESTGVVLSIDERRLLDDDAGCGLAEALFEASSVMSLVAGGDPARRIGALFGALVALPPSADAAGARGSPVGGWLVRALLWSIGELQAARPPALPAIDGSARQSVVRFRRLVDTHHAERWPIARYAGELGISATHLNRLCRRYAGCTALELVHARLAREARRRLRSTSASVETIARELGFDDASYFCRFFRRQTGESPAAWRLQRGG